jgi:hypothetical protein
VDTTTPAAPTGATINSNDEDVGQVAAALADATLAGRPVVSAPSDAGPDVDPEALKTIARGECPDGGGPQCICKKLGKPGQCASLSSLPKCTTCDDDGRFRIGMFTDMCGNCFGTKILDGRVWDAEALALARAGSIDGVTTYPDLGDPHDDDGADAAGKADDDDGLSSRDTREQAQPPSIENSSVGVRRMVIDVESKGAIDALLDISKEVSMFGLVWAPRFMVMSAKGRCVWEIKALREGPS